MQTQAIGSALRQHRRSRNSAGALRLRIDTLGATMMDMRAWILSVACGVSVAVVAACSAPVQTPAVAKSQKREGPVPVAPLRLGSLTISAVHWGLDRGLGQNGGYIAATDTSTGRELWILKIYTVDYDPRRERDVQDVFIVAMTLTASGSLVEIRDEAGRVFVVDPVARSVRPR